MRIRLVGGPIVDRDVELGGGDGYYFWLIDPETIGWIYDRTGHRDGRGVPIYAARWIGHGPEPGIKISGESSTFRSPDPTGRHFPFFPPFLPPFFVPHPAMNVSPDTV